MRARTVHEVIAAEAVSGTPQERYADMKAIASVIANRARMLGVTPEQVVSLTSEFNAYNKPMPAGTQSLVDMAEAAMNDVAVNGPVNNATFYATPAATKNLPKGLQPEAQTTGHVYYSDPLNRAIYTSDGLKSPQSPDSQISGDPLQAALSQPYTANGLTNGISSLGGLIGVPSDMAVTSTSVAPSGVDSAFGANGFLNGTPTTFGGLTPQGPQNSFGDLAAAGPVSSPMGVTASGENWGGLGAEANAVANTGGFDMGRFMDATNFGAAPAPDPSATNNSFSDLAGAQNTGFSSPGFQAVAAQADQNLANMQAQQPTQTVQGPANSFGDLAAAGQQQPSFASALQSEQSLPSGIQAINSIAPPSGLLSGTSLTNASIPGTSFTAPSMSGLLSAPTVTSMPAQYQSFTPPDVTAVDPVAPATAVNIAEDPAVSMPNLDTISVPDQPTIAGPVDTPAVTQQQEQSFTGSFPAAPAKPAPETGLSGLASKLSNKQTALGGLLGGLVAGPVGGLLGALAGAKVANTPGGLGGLFGGGMPASINNIGGGVAATGSVYGGAPEGTQANANNGGTVTSIGGGWSTYTNPMGVTTAVGPNGQQAAHFGSLGGIFGGGGLFGGGGGGFSPEGKSPGLF